METNKSIAKRIIESYSLSFNNEITSRLADIVYSRELGRGELFLDEGQVSKSMGYVEGKLEIGRSFLSFDQVEAGTAQKTIRNKGKPGEILFFEFF